jgi:hypothetical protein
MQFFLVEECNIFLLAPCASVVYVIHRDCSRYGYTCTPTRAFTLSLPSDISLHPPAIFGAGGRILPSLVRYKDAKSPPILHHGEPCSSYS